jgi:hypothetical protein
VADDNDQVKSTVKPQICVAASEHGGSFCLHSDLTVIYQPGERWGV